MGFGQWKKSAFAMECGVVHHEGGGPGELRQQPGLEPVLKQFAVHRALVLQGREDAPCQLRRDKARVFSNFDLPVRLRTPKDKEGK